MNLHTVPVIVQHNLPLPQGGYVLDGVAPEDVCVSHAGHPEGGARRVVLGLEAHEGEHQGEGQAYPGQEPGAVGLKEGQNGIHCITFEACSCLSMFSDSH